MNEISHLCEKLGANVDMAEKELVQTLELVKDFYFLELDMAEVVSQKM